MTPQSTRAAALTLFVGLTCALVLFVASVRSAVPTSEPPATSGSIAHMTFRDGTADFARKANRRPNVGPWLAGCLVMLQLHNYDAAITFCSRAVAGDAYNPDAYRMRGAALLGAHRASAAIDDLDRAILLDPKDADSLALRASAYREEGKYRLAIDGFSDAIRLDPAGGRLWNGRCWTRAVAGVELQDGLSDCQKALQLEPRNPNILDSEGFILLRLKNDGAALRAYKAALLLDPRMASSLFGRGVALFRLGRVVEARRDIQAAQLLDPEVAAPFISSEIVSVRSSVFRCVAQDCRTVHRPAIRDRRQRVPTSSLSDRVGTPPATGQLDRQSSAR